MWEKSNDWLPDEYNVFSQCDPVHEGQTDKRTELQ